MGPACFNLLHLYDLLGEIGAEFSNFIYSQNFWRLLSVTKRLDIV